ncbi:DNA primase small subunit [Natronoarchaeum philippinense]|uniref:DNA primase small subunit PriS n=1 Tax=Natronoarchaeum philippinense TaxID=558529 RepID=A0A285N1M6_NATPI|nr:DNA primase small subunit PriS [Natronoarchaeum philippinense]SNZ03374.1 DNA primase small subunit [Natronoarchaeum philippinense]
MEERTRAYLRGRFRDYYRRTSIAPPPDANLREWGFIPWTAGSGTTMVRHKSLLDLGALDEFLARKRPRHVYFSAGRYDDPSSDTMGSKGWRSSDLVFDLDADHLPGVTPSEDSYEEMLATCKDALLRLLDILETDFGFEDLTVVFSGGRGYHVHVRDDGVRELDREQRREIVDYVRGIDVEFEHLIEQEAVGGTAGRSSPAHKRSLVTDGGWSRRVHRRLTTFVDELLDLPEEDALERLQEFDGIGEGKARGALTAARNNRQQIEAGNVDVHPAVFQLARILAEDVLDAESAPIDEPVTTDTNRLIRLPGSLHGGTGLRVLRIDRDELAGFRPLDDAVTEQFVGQQIRVDVTGTEEMPGGTQDSATISLGGDSFTIEPGAQTVPEHVGVYLMARGHAEKEKE